MFSVIFTILQWIIGLFTLLIVGLAIYVVLYGLYEDLS